MFEQEIVDYCAAKNGAYIDFPFGQQPLCLRIHGGGIFAQVYDVKSL